MTKHGWRESMKSFRIHVDPEKEEELKLIQIENENKVNKILKLIKSINQGNREANLKKKSELYQLIDDIQKQHHSLYALYDNLKGEVRKRVVGSKCDGSSTSSASSDSEPYDSLDESNSRNNQLKRGQRVKDGNNKKLETEDSEDSYLKDKLTSTNEVVNKAPNVESASFLCDTQVPGKTIEHLANESEDAQSSEEKLVDESSLLKEKLAKKEEKFLSLSKGHEVYKRETTAQIKDLEGQVFILKLELEALGSEVTELREQLNCKETEAKQLGEKNLELQNQISELDTTFKKKEDQLSAMLKTFEDNEKHLISKIDKLVEQANNLQSELGSLHAQKDESEEQLDHDKNEGSAIIMGLTDRIDVLQHELESLRGKKTDSWSQLGKESQEMSEGLIQVQDVKGELLIKTLGEQGTLEKEGLEVHVKDLEWEVKLFSSQKRALEEQMTSMENEANQLRVEEDKLHARILELEKRLGEREDEISTMRKTIEAGRNKMSNEITSLTTQVKSLQQDLESLQTEKSSLSLQIKRSHQESSKNLIRLEKQNTDLTKKVEDQQRTLIEREVIMNKLNEEHKHCEGKLMELKLNVQLVGKKFEEVSEDFRKKFEDNLRIMSRRIRVAEQLHVESKEWYRKTREKYEQDSKELVVSLKKIKDISLSANDMLTALDTMALKFEDCSAHFMNRISKVFCELIFAKDWAKWKNKALAHAKDDLDTLLVQLNDKEAEVLGFREKVWKLENKVRESEKIVEQKEEGMVSLGEEKREAIRQLCVWIDYHRSHSDYLKRLLNDVTKRNQNAA